MRDRYIQCEGADIHIICKGQIYLCEGPDILLCEGQIYMARYIGGGRYTYVRGQILGVVKT